MADDDAAQEAARARVAAERERARQEDQARKAAAEEARAQQARGQEAIDGVVELVKPDTPPAQPEVEGPFEWDPTTNQYKVAEKKERSGIDQEIEAAEASLNTRPATKADLDRLADLKQTKKLLGCAPRTVVGAIVALVLAVAAGTIVLTSGGDDNKCKGTSLGGSHGEVALGGGSSEDCPETETTDGADGGGGGPAAPTPDEAVLSAGQVLYQGTSGGELGCITCDGQSRFIHLTRSDTAKGNENRAGQEIVWPESGDVVDFGIRISRPNKGRYGLNLFVNGSEYQTGCALETGWSSCRLADGSPTGRLEQGQRVTLIIGEGGTVDEDGVPVDEGDFTVSWWFVFEPD